ncbi:MAG: RidA family protein [Actinomycetaceae bacterium]|nr:RidA family protein [Actinomycetaceae bacterium]
MSVSNRLEELGIELPTVVPPLASYVPAMIVGDTVRTSGQLPIRDGAVTACGRVGENHTPPADAYRAARLCALNALAAAADVAGGVDNLAGVIKVTGYVASSRRFFGQPAVINGASDLFHDIFGGLHVRSAVGVAVLPQDASVEVEVEFSLRQ